MTNTQPKASVDIEQLKEWLSDEGFSFETNPARLEFNECMWHAWRRIGEKARPCELNGHKVSIFVSPTRMDVGGRVLETVKVGVRGEANEVWWDLQAYSLEPSEVIEKFCIIEESLVKAWNSLADSKEGS